MPGGHVAAAGPGEEAPAVQRRQPPRTSVASATGAPHDLRVAGDPVRDLVAAHEAVRVRAVVGPAGEGGGPVRGHERELVPAVPPASAQAIAALDDQVLAARVGQQRGHRQAGVTDAHHQHVHVVRQRDADGVRAVRLVTLGRAPAPCDGDREVARLPSLCGLPATP